MKSNRTETKKWVKNNLSGINLLGFSVVKNDVYWHIDIGTASNECFYQGNDLLTLNSKAQDKYRMTTKSPISTLSQIEFSSSILGMIMDGMDHMTQFDYDHYSEWYYIFKSRFDETYMRVTSQIAKIVKSYAYKAARRNAQRSLIKEEFNNLFRRWKKDCRLVKQDELYLLIAAAIDELKVSEVMEA